MSDTGFDEVLDSIEIEDFLLKESLDYKTTRGSSGMQLNVKVCPACGGDTWKVYLNQQTGLGSCFHGSCPKGTFNKYSFIKSYLEATTAGEKVNVMGYVKALATELGWRPRQVDSAAVEMSGSELSLPDYLPLPFEGKNLKYLDDRRVTASASRYFNLGFISAGYFGKRVFIPIHDLDGSLVSFQARDITGLAEKKYLFPKGFSATGKILYNGQNVGAAKSVALVEGVFDAISTKIVFDEDAGLRDVVPIASFGMNLSGNVTGGEDDQLSRFIRMKLRGLLNVTILWDGEPKALLKAITAGQTLMKIGLLVKIAILPKGKDPSSADPSALLKAYRSARTLTPGFIIEASLKRGNFYS